MENDLIFIGVERDLEILKRRFDPFKQEKIFSAISVALDQVEYAHRIDNILPPVYKLPEVDGKSRGSGE